VDRIRASLELKVVLQTAVDKLADVLQVDRCSVFWYFHDGEPNHGTNSPQMRSRATPRDCPDEFHISIQQRRFELEMILKGAIAIFLLLVK
jgi:hypothetical protein